MLDSNSSRAKWIKTGKWPTTLCTNGKHFGICLFPHPLPYTLYPWIILCQENSILLAGFVVRLL